ncbi:hypothetical protein AVEN_19558-1 [Araneus ventricosus]|uniref:Uncharacterized protein n=1 Tax=Araneus ventricosus TaxID=182803 RepID=A0A4Y2R1I6_ARAVE|nr:hypothetical protein AVEN_19558-1 [Araneus ventricosus]
MCEPPHSSVGVLHLAERCNPRNQSLAVALTIPQACQGEEKSSSWQLSVLIRCARGPYGNGRVQVGSKQHCKLASNYGRRISSQ